jgi:transcription factor 1
LFPAYVLGCRYIDHIIERLAPTFDRSIPLDIVDIYPALPPWTSKIHDFLKPRTHLLVEPRQWRLPKLQPLLDQPNSAFRHVPWNPFRQKELSQLFHSEFLGATQDTSGGIRFGHVNRNLLVLVNLARASRSNADNAKFFKLYFESCLHHTLMHQYGSPRLLITLLSDQTGSLLPRTLDQRRVFASFVESTSTIVQVAGVNPTSVRWHMKGADIINKSALLTAKREDDAGIRVPNGRAAAALEMAPVPNYSHNERYSSRRKEIDFVPGPTKPWHKEYVELEKKEQEQNGKIQDAAENARLILLRKRALWEARQLRLIEDMASKQEQVDMLERKLREMKVLSETEPGNLPPPDEIKKIVSKIRRLTAEWDNWLPRQHPSTRFQAQNQALERRCFKGYGDEDGLPLLQWDRRPYEPLHVSPNEFQPKYPVALLDIRPDTDSPVLRAQREAAKDGTESEYRSTAQVFLHLCRLMRPFGNRPIDQLLSLFFPSRPMAAIIRAIPSLTPVATVSVSFVQQGNTEKPTFKFEDNCFSRHVWRELPTSVIWDIAAEWQRWPEKTVSYTELHTILGGGTVRHLDDEV